MSDESVVETEGVTVTKSFDAEGFPVPAVTFRVESDRSDPVGLRITDEIPEGFGIEQIGFHPDYGSEHWTATGEGVVRFERTVNPGEAFTTVYGIRMAEDDEPTPFLESPGVEVDPDAIEEEEIDEVVPKESSAVVRELASGERDSVPGLEEEEPIAAEAESGGSESGLEARSDEDAEIIGEPDTEPAEARADEPIAAEAGEEDSFETETEEAAILDDTEPEADEAETATEEPPEAGEKSLEAADEPEEPLDADAIEARLKSEDAEAVEGTPEVESETEEADTDETETGPAVDETPTELAEEEPIAESTAEETMTSDIGSGSIAATLAAEIEAGTVDDDHLEVIQSAVAETAERQSDAVRVEHLQARVSDLEAYTDALEDFIDENGTAQELLEDMESTVSAFQEDLDEIETRLDSASSERDSLDDRLANIDEQVGDVENLEERLDRLRGDLDALDERVDDAESVRFEMEELEDDMEDLRQQVEEVKEWRDQLSNVFGGT